MSRYISDDPNDDLLSVGRARELATEHPHLQRLLNELDALYFAEQSFPPHDWQPPGRDLKIGVNRTIDNGVAPDDALTIAWRMWQVFETPRGLALLQALKSGVEAIDGK